MTRYFTIHPDDPQPRLISQTAAILRHGGVIVYPTDSCYALGCLAMDKTAVDRIIRIRRLNPKHNMTLICNNLSDISTYAKLDNTAFRLIKRLTPGPYTFLLKATKDVPKRLWHPQRKTIGLRVPDHAVVRDILVSLGEPMMSTSLILPDEQLPETEPEQIYKRIGNVVDLIIEGGACGFDQTTVLDLTGSELEVIRKGRGDITGLI